MPSRRAGAAGAQQLALSCQLCVRLEGAGGAVMPPAHRWELAPSPGSYGKAPLEGPVGQSKGGLFALCLDQMSGVCPYLTAVLTVHKNSPLARGN